MSKTLDEFRAELRERVARAAYAVDCDQRWTWDEASDHEREAMYRIADAVMAALDSLAPVGPAADGATLVPTSWIDRLRHDLDAGNVKSALGHARWLVDHYADEIDEARRLVDLALVTEAHARGLTVAGRFDPTREAPMPTDDPLATIALDLTEDEALTLWWLVGQLHDNRALLAERPAGMAIVDGLWPKLDAIRERIPSRNGGHQA